jgi:predicted neutral ceramidase superfamily lipid hydrolase
MMARGTAGGSMSSGRVTNWMEIWDYAGGNSFRAFVAEDMDERNLFVFFDANNLGRDLKKA